MPIQLGLDGDISYKDFIAFVKKLENNLQHVQVLTLSMSPLSENREILASPGITIALYIESAGGQQP